MRKSNYELYKFILNKINENPKITEVELAEETGYTERTIRRYIKVLREQKIISLDKNDKKRYWKIIYGYILFR